MRMGTESPDDIREMRAADRRDRRAASAFVLVLSLLLAGVDTGRATAQTANDTGPARGTIGMDEAVRRALSRNYDLLGNEQNINAAAGRKNQALQGYLPGISARYGYSRFFDADETIIRVDPVTGNAIASNPNSYSYQVGLSQNLLDWGQIKRIQAANRGLDATKLDYRQARADIVLATKQQFYALLAAQLLSDVADSALVVSQQELRRVNSLFELGMVARGDVLKAQVRVSQSQLDVIQARNSVVLERARLARIMGQDPTDDLRADTNVSRDAAIVDSAVVFEEALTTRSDLQAAQQTLQAAEAGVGAAKAGYYPTLRGGLAYNKTPETYGTFAGTRSRTGSLALDFPLLASPLGTKGQIQQNRAQAEQARYQLDKKRIDIQVEVREAVSLGRQANEGLGVATDQLASAEEDLKLSQEKYNVGSGTILELIDAQVALQRARTNLVQAITTVRIAEARLERVRGRTY